VGIELVREDVKGMKLDLYAPVRPSGATMAVEIRRTPRVAEATVEAVMEDRRPRRVPLAAMCQGGK
jgi:hypothetical protein